MTRSKRRAEPSTTSTSQLDDDRPSPPKTRRRNELPQIGDVLIQVECGLNVGEVCLNKLRQGSRGACVKFDGNWMTPNQFQMISGRETAKDWKRSIKHHGKTLKALMNQELLLLEPPVCLCEVCTADDAKKDSKLLPSQPKTKEPDEAKEKPAKTKKAKKKASSKKLDIRIPAVFQKMKKKAEEEGGDIRTKIKTIIDKSGPGSNIYEIVSDLSQQKSEEKGEEREKEEESINESKEANERQDEEAATSAGRGQEEPAKKSPKGVRLRSIIDELRRSKQQTELTAKEDAGNEDGQKGSVLQVNKNPRPKVATVSPLPCTKRRCASPPVKKKSPAAAPSQDFLDITNPAHFSWYLPYYASLGIANMMMAPFLNNQLKDKEDEVEAGEVKVPEAEKEGVQESKGTTSSVHEQSPLDLSKSNPQCQAMTSSPPAKDLEVVPLDLSNKLLDAKKIKSSITAAAAAGSDCSRPRKGSPRLNAAGFLNPSLDAISKWSPSEVTNFVNSVEGCQKYTQNFADKGVSGKSLPYLSLDQMTGQLGMSHASAVSLRSAIDRLLLMPRNPHH